ncbi:hypothetical protein B0H63DRAFT_121697 [Podospora didyma]|uniref:4Fe-4S ferredoxin-type domain-containing protein n=1 Tax=Podospora didyma TaxID=330526 RepID=A0AAE0U503_9PEZI|nr:hypothetical protein B0H63DRAFT_121697 [Podospora didyma]
MPGMGKGQRHDGEKLLLGHHVTPSLTVLLWPSSLFRPSSSSRQLYSYLHQHSVVMMMRSLTGVALSLALFASTPVWASCKPSGCHANDCARAVTGTRRGPEFTAQAKSDCSSFVSSALTVVPTYASACSGTSAYASACSCYGIHGTTASGSSTAPPVLSSSSSSSSPSSTESSTSSTSSTTSSESSTSSSSSLVSSSSSTSSSTSSTSSAPPAPTGCTGGLTSCGGTCKDLRDDPSNCGGCGISCDSGTCSNGACSLNSCTGQTCDTFTACGPGGSCVCASISGGTGFCADGATPCAGLADCATGADCPLGSVCAVGTCCTRNVCIVADTCGGFSQRTPLRLFRPRGVTWTNATIGHLAGYVEV